MDKGIKYYLMIIAAILLVVVGAIWGGAMKVFGDTGAAWLGSVGTISTLAFLIYQNTSQAKEIREERQKREDHEEKQQEMWEEQRKMLTFQKLQMHKSLFNELLSELENSLKITFYDRTGFYKKIFFDNNFDRFSPYLYLTEFNRFKLDSLQEIELLHKRLIDDMTDFDNLRSSRFSQNHLGDLSAIGYKLHLKQQNNNDLGDITFTFNHETTFVINLFSPRQTIHIYEQVIQKLSDFAAYPYFSQNVLFGGGFYNEALFQYALQNKDHSPYTINLEGIHEPLSIIYSSYTSIIENLSPIGDEVDHLSFKQLRFYLSETEKLLFDGLAKADVEAATQKLASLARNLATSLNNFSTYNSNYRDVNEEQKLQLTQVAKRLEHKLKVWQEFNRRK